jgi:hypothetical protein
MDSVFNTPFEMSLRVLLLLATGGSKTSDMLTLADTVVIYGAEFGIADDNLHGGAGYILDEFDTRRELTKQAVGQLVRRGLVRVMRENDGFRFSITPQGKGFHDSLDSDYAAEYSRLANAANAYIGDKTEREVFALMCETVKRGHSYD